MKKKILLSSILAVAILILLSFTNVVGFQNVKTNSNSVVTPLFSIRSNRAINEEQDFEICNYLGKGREIKIPIPKRDNKKALIQDIITRLSQMDYISFKKLVTNVITRLNMGDESNDIDGRWLLLALHLLRTNPDKVQENINVDNNNDLKWVTSVCTVDGEWIQGCLFIIIQSLLIFFGGFLIMIISAMLQTCTFYETCQFTCQQPSFCLIGCGPE